MFLFFQSLSFLWSVLQIFASPIFLFSHLAIVLSDLRFTTFNYPFGIFWLLITPLVSSCFWPLYCLIVDLRLLITLWYFHTFDHCIVCPLIYGFWLPLWYLLTFGHCIVWSSMYDFWLPIWYFLTFGHFIVWSLIYDFWLPFGIFRLLTIVLSDLRFTTSDYLFGIL